MQDEKKDFTLLGFVLASHYRTKIIMTLDEKASTPKQLAKSTNLRIGHVSNVLKRLGGKGLTECVNAEAKRGRIYRLTDEGKKVFEMMRKLGLDETH